MKFIAEKGAILARLDESREALGENVAGLGAAVNLTRRLRYAVRRNPVIWLAGSVGAGVLLSSLLRVGARRSSKVGGRSSAIPARPMILAALAFLGNQLMAFSMPALRHYLEGEVAHWLRRRAPKPSPDDALDE